MSQDKSQMITQVLTMAVGAALIAFYLFGAYKNGRKEFEKTLKSIKKS